MRAALLVLAILVAVHGVLFAGFAWVEGAGFSIPEFPGAEEIFFFGLIAPALIMAAPFKPLLWWLGLMQAPGWFAWPRPLGFVLVYAFWMLVLFGASFLPGAIVRLRRRRALR